jgi:hypothetical protein
MGPDRSQSRPPKYTLYEGAFEVMPLEGNTVALLQRARRTGPHSLATSQRHLENQKDTHHDFLHRHCRVDRFCCRNAMAYRNSFVGSLVNPQALLLTERL